MRLAPLALAVGLLALPGLAQTPEPPAISVTGQGSATAAPDMATIRLGVETQAKEPGAAMEQNSAAVEGVMAKLESAGVAGKDVQTANLSVSPVYDHRRVQEEGGAPKLVGFRVTNEVVANIRDLDGLGAVLSGAVDAGANRINSLSFSIEDDAALRNQARRKAVEDARQTAETLAKAAGVALGPIHSIQSGFQGPRPMPAGNMMRVEMAQSDAAPVAPGESEVTATVHIVWEIVSGERLK